MFFIPLKCHRPRIESCRMAIAEHNLKRFFAEDHGHKFDVSPSYAQGFSLKELCALEEGSESQLLDLNLNHYTDDLGVGPLAEAVAALYNGVKAEDVIVLSGVDAVIMDTLSALVSPGAKVGLQSPGYPPLRNVAEWRGGLVTSWDPAMAGSEGEFDGWDLSAPAITDAETVIATLPHSPFGWSPSREWLHMLVHQTDEREQILIVDEVYRGIDLTADGSGLLPSACELSPRAVVIGGLAKTYGLTGLRIGWVICRDPTLRSRIESHALNGNTNVCTPTDLLGVLAIRHTSTLHEKNAQIARRNLDEVAAFVERSGGVFRFNRPTAGLNVWLDWRGPNSAHDLATSVLEREKVLVADHTLFGVEDVPGRRGGLRVGLGPLDVPDRLAALEQAVARYLRENA